MNICSPPAKALASETDTASAVPDWQGAFAGSGFIPNTGQLDRDDILFYTQGHLRAGLTRSGIILAADHVEMQDQNMGPGPSEMRPVVTSISSVKLVFEGCNQVVPIGMGERETCLNFFIGNESDKWRTGIHPFEEVYYQNIYAGIDARYYLQQDSLKYDIIIHPGADPSVVSMRYIGADSISVAPNGDLVVSTGAGELRDDAPKAFQGSAPVPVAFEVLGNSVSFRTGAYDRTKTLVIDPRLAYSSFLGGSMADYGYDICVNSTRDIYVTGIAPASDFPTTPGAYDTTFNGGGVDGFVCKFSPDGATTIFSTFVGGSSYDNPNDMVLDSNGRIYLAGSTSSTNYPCTANAVNKTYRGGTDACLTIMNPSGTGIIYATFFGGGHYDRAEAVAIDSSLNVYFSGSVYSNTPPPDFYTTPGAYDRTFSGGLQDAFAVKLNADLGSLNYSTLLGGNNAESCYGMYADDQGNAFLSGFTASSNFPTTPGAYDISLSSYDGFIAKLNPTGSALLASTLIGGTSMDTAYDIVYDGSASLFIEGYTYSSNFPMLPNSAIKTFGLYFDMFIVRMSLDLSALEGSTFLGGDGWDMPRALKLGPDGDVYMAGNTSSTNLQVTSDALNATYLGGGGDAFLSRFDANLSVLKFSTYFGGTTWMDQAMGLAVDDGGNAYLTGATSSTDFWLTQNAQSKSCKTGDAFVVKMTLEKWLPSAPTGLCASTGDSYVNLAWSPPDDDGNDAISNYRIYRGTAPGALSLLVERPSALSYNDTSVTNGVTYYYKVAAKNSKGEGAATTELQATPYSLPSEPQNLTCVCGDEYVNLTWDPPANNGGDAAFTYTVYSKTGAFSYDPVLGSLARTWYNATGLINGQVYYFKVTCVNVKGEGPNSTDLMTTPITIPTAPLGFEARTGDGYAALSWLPPSDEGGSAVKGYNVYRSLTLSDPIAVAKNLTGTKFNNTGLANGQTYQFWVRAFNARGEGPASGPLAAIPIKVPGQPQNLTAAVGDKYVNLSWTPPADLGGYPWALFTVLKGTTAEGMVPSATDVNSTYYNFTGLKNGQVYYFTVVAKNAKGEGPASEMIDATPFTIPEQPRSLATTGTDTTVVLAWAEPKSNGGQDITGYVIYRGLGELTLEFLAQVGSVMTYTDTTAVDNITYYYAVSAQNDAGEGPMSTKATGATIYIPPAVDDDDDDVVDDDVIDSKDKDSDGLNDTWEMDNFGNLTYGPSDDPDHDGLKNSKEYSDGTDPMKSDEETPNDTSFMGSGAFFLVVGVIMLVIICLIVIILVMVMRRKKQEPATAQQPARPQAEKSEIEVLPPEPQASAQPDMAPPAPAMPAPAQPQQIDAMGAQIMLPPAQDAGPMAPQQPAVQPQERPMAQAKVVGQTRTAPANASQPGPAVQQDPNAQQAQQPTS